MSSSTINSLKSSPPSPTKRKISPSSSPPESISPLAAKSPGLVTDVGTETLCDNTDTRSETSTASDSTYSIDMVTATLDQDDKLEAYNIDCETAQDMPSRFKEHINKVVKAPRAQPPSPTAKRLAEIQILAKNLNERSGIAVLAPHLLFLPEKLGGEKLIMEIREAVLSSEYLPPAPDHLVKKRWTKLSQSVADTAIGYLTAKAGVELKVSSALTIREERVVKKVITRITANIMFPFLTSEWKSSPGSEGLYHASLQCARDGAVIVNYNHEFFTRAGIAPSVVDTSHYSVACDLKSVELFVHWRTTTRTGTVQHFSKSIGNYRLCIVDDDNPERDMERFRSRLRNILEWAVGPRLDKIKSAIKALSTNDDDDDDDDIDGGYESKDDDNENEDDSTKDKETQEVDTIEEPEAKRRRV